MSMEQNMARIFKALGDENRILILKMLGSSEKCACKLLEELNIRQPTLSHHMKILCDAGIVTGRREGKWTHYSISRQGVGQVRAWMMELLPVEDAPAQCEGEKG